MASMEHFERQCAKASGRTQVKVDPLLPGVRPGTDVSAGGDAQLTGPDPSDPCSKIATCGDCGGKEGFVGQQCGWCRAEVTDHKLLRQTKGGWCSSECVSTDGECSAFAGHVRGGGTSGHGTGGRVRGALAGGATGGTTTSGRGDK
jgi:hypothetical protein